MAASEGAAGLWQRLGEMLIQRRTALDSRWHNRMAFCEATGLSYRLVYDIEEARRTNFGTSTLAAIEGAYRLEPGAITRFLSGGDLYPSELSPSGPAVPPGAEEAAADPALLQYWLEVEAVVGAAEVREVAAAAQEKRPVRTLRGSDIFDDENSKHPDRDASVWDGTMGAMDRDQRVQFIARMRKIRAEADPARRRHLRRALVLV